MLFPKFAKTPCLLVVCVLHCYCERMGTGKDRDIRLTRGHSHALVSVSRNIGIGLLNSTILAIIYSVGRGVVIPVLLIGLRRSTVLAIKSSVARGVAIPVLLIGLRRPIVLAIELSAARVVVMPVLLTRRMNSGGRRRGGSVIYVDICTAGYDHSTMGSQGNLVIDVHGGGAMTRRIATAILVYE